MGGAGSAVTEYLAKGNYKAAILNLGFPDEFINHGTKESQLIKAGLNKEAIVDLIKKSTYEEKNLHFRSLREYLSKYDNKLEWTAKYLEIYNA